MPRVTMAPVQMLYAMSVNMQKTVKYLLQKAIRDSQQATKYAVAGSMPFCVEDYWSHDKQKRDRHKLYERLIRDVPDNVLDMPIDDA